MSWRTSGCGAERRRREERMFANCIVFPLRGLGVAAFYLILGFRWSSLSRVSLSGSSIRRANRGEAPASSLRFPAAWRFPEIPDETSFPRRTACTPKDWVADLPRIMCRFIDTKPPKGHRRYCLRRTLVARPKIRVRDVVLCLAVPLLVLVGIVLIACHWGPADYWRGYIEGATGWHQQPRGGTTARHRGWEQGVYRFRERVDAAERAAEEKQPETM